MRVIDSKTEMWQACLASQRPLGLVPTMGSLHPGHMALVERARAECATAAATIFVNPTQFGPNEDLETYPRSLERDLSMLEQAGVDLVFTPNSTEIYPRGFNTWVDVLGSAQGSEGLYRPGHFRGVATVVAKLLNITRPDRAYFGQKDGNQTAVIRQLARDLDMMTEIVVVPTVREPSGLAYSSRNAYLDPYQRNAADIIYRALTHASALYASGQRHAATITNEVRNMINSEPLVNGIDYVSLTDAESMNEIEWIERPAMLAVAVHIGGTRLIDNIILGRSSSREQLNRR